MVKQDGKNTLRRCVNKIIVPELMALNKKSKIWQAVRDFREKRTLTAGDKEASYV